MTEDFRDGRGRFDCLKGYVILDLTAFLSGPFGTEILGAMGATVIKIEPTGGEYYRNVRPPWAGSNGVSLTAAEAGADAIPLTFLKRNVGKLGLCVDLRAEAGQRVLEKLVSSADALVHNYKPGTASRLNLSPERMQKINPKLVWVAIDGLGPYHEEGDERPVIDNAIQALTGALRLGMRSDESPREPALPISDVTAGLYAAVAVLSGLLGRDGRMGKTEASSFEVSLMGAMAATTWSFRSPDAVARWHLGEVNSLTVPHPVNRSFRTADDKWVFVTSVTDDQWEKVVVATCIPELDDARYKTRDGRRNSHQEINALLEEWALCLDRDRLLELLERHDVSAWPLRDSEELMEDDRFTSNFLYEVEHPTYGKTGLYSAVNPIRGVLDPGLEGDSPAPLLGQHTRAVLKDFAHLSESEIELLERAGVVKSYGAPPETDSE